MKFQFTSFFLARLTLDRLLSVLKVNCLENKHLFNRKEVNMLKTQVDYLAYLEERRHNQTQEWENWRTNRRAEQLKFQEISNQAIKTSADIKQNAQKVANERWNMERNAEVNRQNAVTNRLNAINQQRRNFNDWNIALNSNRIAAENAATNRLNALSSERQSYSSLGQYEVAQARMQNEAGIGWMNAATNQENARLRQRELDMMRTHYMWQDTASMINSTANVANAIFKGAAAMPDVANTAYVMGRLF